MISHCIKWAWHLTGRADVCMYVICIYVYMTHTTFLGEWLCPSVVSRNLQTLWESPFWKPAQRMPQMWSRPLWPWLLKSRRGWALGPQPEEGRSPTSSWLQALLSRLHQVDAAEKGTTLFNPLPKRKKIGMWEQDEVACICTVYNVATLPKKQKVHHCCHTV